MDLVLSLDLMVCNHGSSPTREKDGYTSYIDITLASVGLMASTNDWMVLDEEAFRTARKSLASMIQAAKEEN